MGMAAFNRMRREQAKKAKLAESKGEQSNNETDIQGLIDNLSNLKSEDLKVLAAHFEIAYENAKQAKSEIKAKLAESKGEQNG